MGYILKDSTALLSTKLTDAARKKMSEGNFNISYFQVGDSEVCYDCNDTTIHSSGMVLDSQYNLKNLSPIPQKSQSNIKYPLYVDTEKTNTFGIPVKASIIDPVFNPSDELGFFTTGSTGDFDTVLTTSAYTINSNYIFDISILNSGTTIALNYNNYSSYNGQVNSGDFLTLFFGNNSTVEPLDNNFPILTYKVVGITGDTSLGTATVYVDLDRKLPDLQSLGFNGTGRALFYPSGMTELYDIPIISDVISFESDCYLIGEHVKIWNMNIPWTESPAGVFSNGYKDHNYYESKDYVGTKEYLGYNSNDGQIETGSTYYYNSFSEKIILSPSDQKSIAIVHYTNQLSENFYGEKFALQPYDAQSDGDTYGAARNFKVHLPTLMWHKSNSGTMGEVFYVDPPGYDSLNLFEVNYIKSSVNSNMNSPGIRYYHLWDTNTNTNGYPNRVGKVWPDLKIITFDDDEIIASLSNKSNRNWTLPAPKLGLITPNTLNGSSPSDEGLLSGTSETLWLTYRFNNSEFTNSLHCNYYTKITGTDPDCPPDSADVTINFGNEFPFLVTDNQTTTLSGFSANDLVILAQKVTTGERPSPNGWYEIDVTNQMSAYTVNNYVSVSGLTNTTFIITYSQYQNAVDNNIKYRLNNYIDIPTLGSSEPTLNFGGEYYFYGEIETEIQATIYEMQYLCNLGNNQFKNSSNPTWSDSDNIYVTEIGLYDDEKNLMIITKVQSPELRQGVQQYNIKLDF